MKKWKILVTAPRALPVVDLYKKELGKAGCEVAVHCPAERLEEDQLLPLVGDIDGVICGDDRFTKRVLDAATRLKVISKWGTGLDSIDVKEAKRKGIQVCNSPGAFSDPVADSVMGYILLFARKLDRMSLDMKAGQWQRIQLLSLRECTLGIIGLGHIGCAVARRASAFGMKLLGFTLTSSAPDISQNLNIEIVSLDRLLSESDFVTLHADLRLENRAMINAERLAHMKSTAILINTARGGLIDESALISALREGQIAGAALDVFEQEPLPDNHPLRGFENVYLAPHNANASVFAAEQVHINSIRNLLQSLDIGT